MSKPGSFDLHAVLPLRYRENFAERTGTLTIKFSSSFNESAYEDCLDAIRTALADLDVKLLLGETQKQAKIRLFLRKMDQAAEQLIKDHQPITQGNVAHIIGYKDDASLSRRLKQLGICWKEWKEQFAEPTKIVSTDVGHVILLDWDKKIAQHKRRTKYAKTKAKKG